MKTETVLLIPTDFYGTWHSENYCQWSNCGNGSDGDGGGNDDADTINNTLMFSMSIMRKFLDDFN